MWFYTVLLMISILSAPLVVEGDETMPKRRDLISVKIRIGLKEKKTTTWQGNYRLTKGKIIATDGWRLAGDDFAALNRFKIQVRRAYPFKWFSWDPETLPYEPNGFILTLEDVRSSSRLLIKMPQWDVSIPAGKLTFGQRLIFLNGNMDVERVPTSSVIVASPAEDAFPSAVAIPGGGVAIAYIRFTHAPGFEAPLKKMKTEPRDFSFLAVPPIGDQVMYTELKDSQWTSPIPLTPPCGDIFRTATAVDGSGRVWIFWSENVNGNWDIYARMRAGGRWGSPIRLTMNPGPDIHHVSTTDSEGFIWLAWQGFRGNNSDIFVVRQQGTSFGEAECIGSGPANEWSPSIAASSDGDVTAAWDSYGHDNYDVLLRMYSRGSWEKVQSVATTQRNELRPFITYDKNNRLWIAYEIAPEGWGKDFGLYDRSFSPLYSDRQIGLKILAGKKFYSPLGNVNHTMPTTSLSIYWAKLPACKLLVTGPKLASDAQGRIWLSARVRMDMFINRKVGSTWINYLTTCDSKGWKKAIPILNSDGLLHESPVLLPAPGGGLYIVSSSDGRFRNAAFYYPRLNKVPKRTRDIPPATTQNHVRYPDSWVNWEISVSDTGRLESSGDLKLREIPGDVSQWSSSEAQKEALEVAAIRSFRTKIGGKTMRILRGEFHRHTEISSDGGEDGSLFDMWRYGLDIASLDWLGSGDHKNGIREYTWWLTQKTCDIFHVKGTFMPMFSYERNVPYPIGHRNVLFARRGVRVLPPLGENDTQVLYKYLKFFKGICSVHTSSTDMGTDWRDNHPEVEPIVEIYQGRRQNYEKENAPRANSPDFSFGGWRPLGMVSCALHKGYRLGFQASSDHISTHISYGNVFVEIPTREAILNALKMRHVYAATDNIIAEFRCGSHFMGDDFAVNTPPTLYVKLIGTAPFERVVIVKDGNYVYTVTPNKRIVEFDWTDRNARPGKLSYYYVRGEQVGKEVRHKVRSTSGKPIQVTYDDGEIVWCSPMWITYITSKTDAY